MLQLRASLDATASSYKGQHALCKEAGSQSNVPDCSVLAGQQPRAVLAPKFRHVPQHHTQQDGSISTGCHHHAHISAALNNKTSCYKNNHTRASYSVLSTAVQVPHWFQNQTRVLH